MFPGEPSTDAAINARIARIGVWMFVTADMFFFAGWYFAFFYLRALNNNQAWIIQGLTRPNRAFGTVVIILVVVSAACYFLASRTAGTRSPSWSGLTAAALVLGLAACLLQGYGMWHLGFGLTQGGYPSVFTGLIASWIVQVLVAMIWLGTVVAQSTPGGDTIARPAAAVAFKWILIFLAGNGVITYILLYLVA